jgi:hypothetical protein
MKKNLLIILLTFAGFAVLAQPTRTVKNGNWSDPTVWDRGVPTRTTDARVMHNIIIDVNAEVRNLLDISPGASLTNTNRDLFIFGDLVVSEPSGFNESGSARTEIRGGNSTISGKISFNRLRIYKDKNSNTVVANDSLFVKAYLYTVRGTLNVSSAAIILEANSSREANIGYSTIGSIVGPLVWQKYINRCNEWSTYSVPMAGSFDAIAASSDGRMIYTGFPGGVDYPTYTFVNTYFYDETNGYVVPSSTSDVVNRGVGYWYWNSDEVFNPNNSNESIPQEWMIQLTQNGFSTAPFNFNLSFANDGFNLVGNPYPGVLNWNSGAWTKNNIENAIYYWNTCTQSYSSYVNGSGTNGGDQWIPAGQGFWVQATGSNPTLTADTKCLSLGTLSAKPLKNGGGYKDVDEEEQEYSYVLLTLNGDETIVRFTESASTDFDNGKDARKILAPSFVPDNSSIRTVLNGVNYSINALPIEDLIIPLDVKGQGELTFTGANDFADIDIYLEDRLTGELIDMKANQSYVFDNSQTGFTHRFNIITKSKLLSASTLNEVKLSVYPNPFSDEVSIMSGVAFDRVDVYNMLGALVISQANTSSLNNKVDVSTLNSGMYVIKVYNNNEELGAFLTKKL